MGQRRKNKSTRKYTEMYKICNTIYIWIKEQSFLQVGPVILRPKQLQDCCESLRQQGDDQYHWRQIRKEKISHRAK